MTEKLDQHNRSYLWASLFAIIPALLVVVPGILQSGLGYFGANNALDLLFAKIPVAKLLINPLVIVIGLLHAFVLNTLPILKFRMERQTEGLTGSFSLKSAPLHWLFIGAIAFLALIILIYAFFENFAPAFH